MPLELLHDPVPPFSAIDSITAKIGMSWVRNKTVTARDREHFHLQAAFTLRQIYVGFELFGAVFAPVIQCHRQLHRAELIITLREKRNGSKFHLPRQLLIINPGLRCDTSCEVEQNKKNARSRRRTGGRNR